MVLDKYFRIIFSDMQDCENPSAEVDVFKVFGVLFTAVTGILAGANMTGELVNPGRSIPAGTLGACGLTFVTYTIINVLTMLTCMPSKNAAIHFLRFKNSFVKVVSCKTKKHFF